MVKAFESLFLMLFKFLKIPLYGLGGFLCIIGFMCLCFRIYFYKDFKARPKSDFVPLPKRSLLLRVFWDAPKQFIYDLAHRPANFFPVHGLIIFEGRQGSGKTSSMVHYIHDLQKQYPHVKVITNFEYASQETSLVDWRQLITYKNGFEGVVVGIDELQNWFSSKQSANFPPEMLSVVTQNRKNRRVILGTAQSFYMVAKDIRSQTTELRRCRTLAGVFTIVHRLRPIINSEGAVERLDNIGWYCWVHNQSERESYDTYKAIESLSKSGFQDKPVSQDVSVFVPAKEPQKKKRFR
ncbi:MAG: hypothetical protein IK134_08400 [Oscillospiraceae bacterium]|nr:hypothetical protein [Oscillospiraceae bacterium]